MRAFLNLLISISFQDILFNFRRHALAILQNDSEASCELKGVLKRFYIEEELEVS